VPFKSRRRPVSTDKRFRKKNNGDYGTPERWQHSGRILEMTERAGILAARVTEEHIVDVLVLRGLLDRSQSDAAFRLKLDFQPSAVTIRNAARLIISVAAANARMPKKRRTNVGGTPCANWGWLSAAP
jgi:hypothetical protein